MCFVGVFVGWEGGGGVLLCFVCCGVWVLVGAEGERLGCFEGWGCWLGGGLFWGWVGGGVGGLWFLWGGGFGGGMGLGVVGSWSPTSS